jgi:hypothetical protein
MSSEKFSVFHCLTETGWLSIDADEIPVDWVRIYEVIVHQGSPFGEQSRHWQVPKTNPAWTEAGADLLEKQFPRPEIPRELSPESLKSLGL